MSETTVDCIELRVTVPQDAWPVLEPLCWLLSPNGLQTEDAGTWGAADVPAGHTRVVLFVAPGEAGQAAVALQAELAALGVSAEVGARDVLRQDWNRVWKEHYRPLTLGRRLRIEPAWLQEPEAPGALRIVIDPGMAFGTGTHETTQLAMIALETWAEGRSSEGVRMLDVGTGSGILAILAVKLGCASAIGTENDDVALPSARDNVLLNGVQDRVEMKLLPDPALLAPETYGLVVANIISAVLVPMRDALVGRLAPGGTLILSGILAREVEEVRDWYLEAGVRLVSAESQGEWASLTLAAA
jgi:ribosomal protein L11 methyltransferase